MTIFFFFVITIPSAVTAATEAAYGQGGLGEVIGLHEPNENTDRLIAEAMNRLQNITQNDDAFGSVVLTDDGELNIRFDNGTPNDIEDDISVFAHHNYTLENGYEFRRDEIIKPDGTPLFTSSSTTNDATTTPKITYVQQQQPPTAAPAGQPPSMAAAPTSVGTERILEEVHTNCSEVTPAVLAPLCVSVVHESPTAVVLTGRLLIVVSEGGGG